jgi:hypothetical protein
MAVILNASTSSGFVQSADTSGEIVLQNNGTTRLTVNASGVTIPTLTATTVTGTITQGTAVASTSGTSIDFTGIPSWAKKITVMFDNLSCNATFSPTLRLGTSSGFEATGYNGGIVLSDGSLGSTVGIIMAETSLVAAATLSGHIVISLLNNNTWAYAINGYALSAGYAGGGTKTLAATLDRLRITTTQGTPTFDLGSINIQYEG